MKWRVIPRRILRRFKRQKIQGVRGLNAADIYVNAEKRFAWVSNPKVACTSIRHSLCSQESSLERDYRMEPVKNVLGKKVPMNEIVAELNQFFTFAFVRHPEQRLISAYKNKIFRHMSPKQTFRPKMQILADLGLDPAEINHEVTFDQFLSVIFDSDAEQLNRHWRPQTMVLDIDRIRYSHIGKLETFDSSWREICQVLELDADVVINLLTQKGRKKQSNSSAQDPVISKQQRAAIRAYYREDYRRFKYS